MRIEFNARPSTSVFSLLALGAAVVFLGALVSGCVVKDELKDGLREMRGEMADVSLDTNADGSGRLNFKFRYGIALVDDAGVQPFPWEYRLVDSDRRILASNAQEMRKEESGKTRVLVTGERARKLDVPPGTLVLGRKYIVWILVHYGEEPLFELLWPVTGLSPGASAEPDGDVSADASFSQDAGVGFESTSPVPQPL